MAIGSAWPGLDCFPRVQHHPRFPERGDERGGLHGVFLAYGLDPGEDSPRGHAGGFEIHPKSPEQSCGPTAIDWNSVPVKTNATGWTRQFFNSPIATAPTFECHATTVNSGQSTHAPSTHPDDREEAIVIQSGTVEAYVKGDWKRLGPGGVVFNAAHEMQAIRNAGDTPATYFVLMWQRHIRPSHLSGGAKSGTLKIRLQIFGRQRKLGNT